MFVRIHLTALCLVLGCPFFFGAANAAGPLVFESFESDASNSSLLNSDGGTGWSKPWMASKVSAIIIPKTLLYKGEELQINGGAKVLRQGASGDSSNQVAQSTRTFDPISNNPVYISFLLEGDGFIKNEGFLSLWVTNPDSTVSDGFSVRIRDGGLVKLTSPTQNKATDRVLEDKTLYFIVLRISSDGPSGRDDYDQIECFINPQKSSEEPDQADGIAITSDSNLDEISQIGIRFAQFKSDSDSAYIDVIRIGESWEDVTSSID